MIFSALVTAVTVAVSNAQGDVFHNGANTNQIISRSDFIGAVAAEVGEDQVIRGDITNGNAPKMPAKVSEGSGNDILLKTFVTNSKKFPYLSHPFNRQRHDWNFEDDKVMFKFEAYTPSKYDVCYDPAPGNDGPLTTCDMLLTFNHDDEGLFNYANLIFIDTCYDDALIDVAYLFQWKWVKCGFWDGCGLDGGYWKSGPKITWGVSNNGYSWCLGDDKNFWKQYSQCGFPCHYCGEGHWVPTKKCSNKYVFRKDGNVYTGSP